MSTALCLPPFCIISLTRGEFAICDPQDYEVLSRFSWFLVESGINARYAATQLGRQRKSKQRSVRMHKLLVDWDEVDHKNLDGLDNRRVNLRPSSRTLNQANKPLQRNSTTGYKGVSFHKARRRYVAYIDIDNVRTWLGYYAESSEAAKAYDFAALVLFGEFARTNFTYGVH